MPLSRQEHVSGMLLPANMNCILSVLKGLPKKLYSPKIRIVVKLGSKWKKKKIKSNFSKLIYVDLFIKPSNFSHLLLI